MKDGRYIYQWNSHLFVSMSEQKAKEIVDNSHQFDLRVPLKER